MGFQQQSYDKHQNCCLIPIFSEFLEIYDSDVPFFQSSESNFYEAIEADHQQAGNICDDHDHFDEINHQIVHLEKVKQCPMEHSGAVFSVPSEFDSSKAASRRNVKPRMKWTQDLHERFVDCVNRLGGAEKATPKAILKLMSSNTLTIFHVKSHLQKYRVSKYVAEYSKENSKNKTTLDCSLRLDSKSGMQIKEALEHVNKRLHEQVEIQHHLQMLIEEQGKQLKMVLEQQERTNKNIVMKALKISDSTTLQHSPCNSFEDDHVLMTEDSGSSRSQSDV